MQDQKFFTVIAGRKEPATELQGTLNKRTGMPDMNAQKVSVTTKAVLILNYSRVWGQRVYEGENPKGKKVSSINDPNYKGKIKFLPFGDSNGEMIETRWLPNSSSLDKQYQTNVQKLN